MESHEKKNVLSGEICYLKFKIQSDEISDKESMDFRYPWRILEESNIDLRRRMESIVKETLGEQFEIKSLTVGRGSIEIIAIIATTYYTVSKYKNFIESIDLMIYQCKKLLQKYFGDRTPSKTVVTTSWSAAPSLNELKPESRTLENSPKKKVPPNIVTTYLVLSHFLLTATLIFLLLVKYLR